MQLTEKKKKYTVQDYEMLEEGAPFQLVDNDLIMSPSPTPEHQWISAKLTQALLNYIDSTNNNGIAFAAPIDVYFDNDNVFQPDVIYIAENRKDELVKDKITGAPDLIIEILSPSNAYYDLRQKMAVYQQYGVKEYLIIDPIQKNADLYIWKEGLFILQCRFNKTEEIVSVLLPGFKFDLQKVFK